MQTRSFLPSSAIAAHKTEHERRKQRKRSENHKTHDASSQPQHALAPFAKMFGRFSDVRAQRALTFTQDPMLRCVRGYVDLWGGRGATANPSYAHPAFWKCRFGKGSFGGEV